MHDTNNSKGKGKVTLAETVRIVQHDTKQVYLHPCSLLNGKLRDLLHEDRQDAFLIYYRKVSFMVSLFWF